MSFEISQKCAYLYKFSHATLCLFLYLSKPVINNTKFPPIFPLMVDGSAWSFNSVKENPVNL